MDGFQNRDQQVYNRAGKACSRCGTKIRRATQGDDNRLLYLVRGMPDVEGAVLRVGHKGADLIVPGNTLASFDAALEVGVDMIEFDVLPVDPDGRQPARPRTRLHVRRARQRPHSRRALDHLAATGIPLDVDLKLTGYEERVVAALGERGSARALADLIDGALEPAHASGRWIRRSASAGRSRRRGATTPRRS